MQEPKQGISLKAKVIKNYDGDTITLEFTGTMRLRLINYSAKEITSKTPALKELALKQKENLTNLCPPGQEVVVFIPNMKNDFSKITSLGRVLGYLFVNGKDVGEILGEMDKND